jgi:hypothetical protein
MPKHTAGPWKYRNGSLNFAPGIYGPQLHGIDSNWIADVEVGKPEEREANIQLICAAPRMLEALEHFVSADESGLPFDDFKKLYKTLIAEARAAIAAAKGE